MPFRRARRSLWPLWLCLVPAALAALVVAWPTAQAAPDAALGEAQPAAPAAPPPIFLPIVYKYWPQDIWVSRVEIIQGITMSAGYQVHIAGRPAVMRVFVGLSGPPSLAGVTARLTRYVGGAAQDSLTAGPITALPAPNEGLLADTLNFTLPAHWLAAGTSYVLELDHNNTIPEGNEANNRVPAAGQQSFNFVAVPTLEVVIVPVQYNGPNGSSLPPTANLAYLTWMPFKVYPIAQINYTLRGTPLVFNGDLRNGDGWVALLNAVTALHAAEDPQQSKVYYALVDSIILDGCSGGCIAGIGWVNNSQSQLKSAAGFAGFPNNRNEASPTFTHEMGHNFGRGHAPCGTTGPPYPYPGGIIGQWGYDLNTALLRHPTTYKDYMSYCGPEWTSDFTYRALYDAWSWAISSGAAQASAQAPQPAWAVSGQLDEAGVPQLTSIQPLSAPLSDFTTSTVSPYQVEVLDAAGRVLAAYPVTPLPFAIDYTTPDGEGGHADERVGFFAVMPALDEAASLRLAGPAGSTLTDILPSR